MLYGLVFIGLVDLLAGIIAVILAQANPKHTSEGVKLNAEYIVSIEWDKMIDADVDLWAAPPPGSTRPILYNNREGGALALDRDSRGFSDDKQVSNDVVVYLPHREVMTMRGIIPGHYAFGVHLYQYRRQNHGIGFDEKNLDLIVHYRAEKLNPSVKTVIEGDLKLQWVGDAANFVAFDVASDGSYTMSDPPLTPIANTYYKSGSPGGPGITTPSYSRPMVP